MAHALQPDHQQHHGVLITVRTLLEIVIIAIFILTFLVQPSRIPSESMVPTLRVGDFLLVDKQSYTTPSVLLPPTQVHRGDLIVFHHAALGSDGPKAPSIDLVKRVIGLPGDHIHLRNDQVFVNGQPLAEPYAIYTTSLPNNFRDRFPSLREVDPDVDPNWWMQLRRTISGGEITVPPDHFFVLGDNRNNSDDSRYWGFVPRATIVGRPFVALFTAHQTHRLRDILQNLRILR